MELMSSEDKYREMPDHSHYIICSDRITAINEKGKKAFYYTFITALLLSAGSMFGIRFNILSILSDLIVGRDSANSFGMILSGMLNIFSSLFLIFLAVFGKAKYKFCNVILFSMYLAMPISCFMNMGGRSSDIITIALGTGGIIVYFPMLSAWRDYKVISRTEGFPYFSERLTHQLENPDYKSNYREDYADEEKSMDVMDKKFSGDMPEKKAPEKIDMEIPSEIPVEIPHRGDSKKKREEDFENHMAELELARKFAEKANKFDFEIQEEKNNKNHGVNK